jgi:predicted nucleic acid-binding protein
VILVDSSVWVEHLRRRHSGLCGLLDEGRVAIHPFVVGEIALGMLKNRAEILELLAELPLAPVVRHEDALAVVERRGLAGAGIGWVDAHLLAAGSQARDRGAHPWRLVGAIGSIVTSEGGRRMRPTLAATWPATAPPAS